MTSSERFQKLINLLRDSNISFEMPRNWWYGHGSAYIYIDIPEGDSLKLRISDHAPVPGRGGRYYNPLYGGATHSESDISIHPGSGVTLRNVIQIVRQKSFEKDKQ